MKWFKHDGNALHDAKIEKLVMKYGIEGYGLYFACVEIIAGNLTPENVTFELEHDAEILAYKFKVDTLRVEEVMRYCVDLGLFEINGSNRITCMKLANRLDNSLTQNKEIKETLKNFKSLKAEETRIDKNREDKERVYLESYPQGFEDFCTAYPKHVEKAKTYTQYELLIKTNVQPEKLMIAAENYRRHVKAEGTESKYIKAAHNFLKDAWRDYLAYKAPPKEGVSGWTCKCGHVNNTTGKICGKCGEFRE